MAYTFAYIHIRSRVSREFKKKIKETVEREKIMHSRRKYLTDTIITFPAFLKILQL